MAPELINNLKTYTENKLENNEKSNIYSFGIIIL